MKNKATTLNEKLILHGESERLEKVIRLKDRDGLLSILKIIGLNNPDMSDVDFIIKHTKLKEESLIRKVFKYF